MAWPPHPSPQGLIPAQDLHAGCRLTLGHSTKVTLCRRVSGCPGWTRACPPPGSLPANGEGCLLVRPALAQHRVFPSGPLLIPCGPHPHPAPSSQRWDKKGQGAHMLTLPGPLSMQRQDSSRFPIIFPGMVWVCPQNPEVEPGPQGDGVGRRGLWEVKRSGGWGP